MSRWLGAEVDVLFTSPEKALKLHDVFRAKSPRLLVIDEAHAISTWGQTFRPLYRRIGVLSQNFSKTQLLAMTATARTSVENDIAHVLQAPSLNVVRAPLEMTNLHLSAWREPSLAKRSELIVKIARISTNRPMVVFCLTRKRCEMLAAALRRQGIDALSFHSMLPHRAKQEICENFMGSSEGVLVATSAFEMGVNKLDIRTVVHFDLPGSLESYVQAVGRAGRDGQSANALLLYSDGDLDVIGYMQERYFSQSAESAMEVYNFANARTCRLTFLRRVFSYAASSSCGRCDNCIIARDAKVK